MLNTIRKSIRPKTLSGNFRTAGRKGFTLIELLIVVSLGALMSMAVYSMFASAVNMSRRISQNLFEEDIAVFFEKIGREISNQVVYTGIPFEGTREGVEFAAPIGPDGEFMNRGVGRVEYAFDNYGKGAFTRKQQNAHEVYKEIEIMPVVMLNNVREVEFAYFVYNKTDKIYEWTDEWSSVDQKGQIPAAIRLRLDCRKGEERYAYQRTMAVPVAESTR